MFSFKKKNQRPASSSSPRQIMKLAYQLAKVGSQMFSNPVIALKNELISISNSEDVNDSVARDFAKVPLKYHALLLQEYVNQWRKLNTVSAIEHTETVDKFENRMMDAVDKVMPEVESGYQTPLVVFDKVMHMDYRLVDQSAFKYLVAPSSQKFALLWLDDLAKMGLDA